MGSTLYKYHNFICPYCGLPLLWGVPEGHPRSITRDHVIPRCVCFKPDKGRLSFNKGTNRVICCYQCNFRKGDKTLEQWLEELINFYKVRKKHITLSRIMNVSQLIITRRNKGLPV